ncbi:MULTISPECIES: ribosome small subunit-dependent GTPase A [Terrabacteria group]|uniref:ribosome small subunit-dependent GTPase A n=1 Tax=Bacillati TaxID=1783272 RepID=UPI00193A3605|nr:MULTISPECIES: ribosome small subunit-dependent GTPase A [Terrabacteria group]MBW9212369.1 ribosome small subunit-dependent GTPase A [Trueperella sp. zg.1013]QRG86098.1 ribosome small subunit-dependent GTPase A [Bulleidia sp. zg-1006]
MKAKIIKIVSKNYGVFLEDTKEKVSARVAGKVRLQFSPVVGDMVEVIQQADCYVIVSILARRNSLIRPAIANVDQAFIVMSVVDPNFSTALIDRLSILIKAAGIEPILVITKTDLEYPNYVEKEIKEYETGRMLVIRCEKGFINPAIQHTLAGKITVLTGQSGAGKSTLLNTLDPNFQLETQEISKALGRGKHTTRHTELHEVAGGLVADTPGFSSLSFAHLEIKNIAGYIPDFEPYVHQCRFNDCLHENEPDCAIKEAVAQGCISKTRYQSYLQVLTLMIEETRRMKR